MDRRPTQSDVAKAAGVHRATVSLVLSNHPSIPAKTKERVMKCVEELGYSPDPMLSALAAYRGFNRPSAYHGTLAWLTNDPSPEKTWRDISTFCNYFEGASYSAKKRGYNLEVFDYKQSALTPKRLASIFRSRNIQGILVPPQLKSNVRLNFEWKHFSAVTFGHSLLSPQLHTVGSAQFRSMVQLMRHLKSLGYERIGYHFLADHDERTDHNYRAGYLVETYEPGKDIIPPYSADMYAPDFSPESLKDWCEKYRLDAVVTIQNNIVEVLRSMGIRIPRDMGVAVPHLVEKNSRISGMYENPFHVGEVATECLVNMIHHGKYGLDENLQRIYLECEWNAGETVRQQGQRKPAVKKAGKKH